MLTEPWITGCFGLEKASKVKGYLIPTKLMVGTISCRAKLRAKSIQALLLIPSAQGVPGMAESFLGISLHSKAAPNGLSWASIKPCR